jgi:hypothetical protein
MGQAVNRRNLTAEARVQSQESPCETSGGQSWNMTAFSPSTSVSPASIIPPTLHTHSFFKPSNCLVTKRT